MHIYAERGGEESIVRREEEEACDTYEERGPPSTGAANIVSAAVNTGTHRNRPWQRTVLH